MFPPQAARGRPIDDVGSRILPSHRGVERAQDVARLSVELAKRSGSDRIGETTLELMRAGNHDPATLQRALALCRARVRSDPTALDVKAAIRLLRRTTTFLGARPQMFATRQAVSADPRPGGRF
jgi:hypothetical protein